MDIIIMDIMHCSKVSTDNQPTLKVKNKFVNGTFPYSPATQDSELTVKNCHILTTIVIILYKNNCNSDLSHSIL